MTYTATAPRTPYSAPAQPSKSSLAIALDAALEHARRMTEMNGVNSIEVAIAWETVAELQRAKERQIAPVQSAFLTYCDANPDAPEARMYDL